MGKTSLLLVVLASFTIQAQAKSTAPLVGKTFEPSGAAGTTSSSVTVPAAENSPTGESRAELNTAVPERKLSDYFGMSYAIFFNGPGLNGNSSTSPNFIGRPANDGLFTSNTISFRFKLTKALALDLQTRSQFVFNDDRPANRRRDNFEAFRWESPSLGVSGDIAKGETWSLRGAINSDFPYTLPSPFTGFTSQGRTTIATPGMFAQFRWKPLDSKWSVFSIVGPRMFIYEDRNAVEPQFIRGGRIAGNKREFDLWIRPALSYAATRLIDVSVGTSISYNKQVVSEWNPFNASVVQNGDGPEWRLDPMPLQVGSTLNISKELRVFTYVQGFPIERQRFDAVAKRQVAFADTVSAGVDLTGNLF